MTNRSFRIPDEILGKLETFAERQQRSCNFIVNQALLHYIHDKEEEERRWKETLVALKQIDHGETVSGEKALAWLESWGKTKPAVKRKKPRKP